MLQINEPINVWAFFRGNKIEPYVFFWQKRRISITSINLVHTSKDGANLTYHFSVSANNNFYRLGFEMPSLKWRLEEVEEGEEGELSS